MSVVGGKVLDTLRKLAKGNDVALSQLSLQVQTAFEMSSGADVFGKVKSMITEMIDKLVAEAAEEADHKAWCDKEMSEAQEQLADIAKQQAAMDEMRAEEKAAYLKAKKDYEDGVEGLTMALEILREYYSAEPALLQQPSVSTHSASGDAATGIIGILEVSQSDFSKLLADANVEEETAVKEYEKVSHENAVQKTMKEQDVKYQLKEKTSLEKNVADFKEDRSSEQAELDAVLEYFAKVKPGCTTKPMTYEERKKRREDEIAGLKEALSILESETPAAFLAIRTARRVA